MVSWVIVAVHTEWTEIFFRFGLQFVRRLGIWTEIPKAVYWIFMFCPEEYG